MKLEHWNAIINPQPNSGVYMMIGKCLLLVIIMGITLCLFACTDENSKQLTITPLPSATEPTGPPPVTAEPLPSTTKPAATPVESPGMDGNEINLDLGQTWTYVFFEDGTEFGFNECEIKEVVKEGASIFYVINSELQLNSSTTCKPTVAEAAMRINQYDTPIEYTGTASIGSG